MIVSVSLRWESLLRGLRLAGHALAEREERAARREAAEARRTLPATGRAAGRDREGAEP